MKRKNTLLYCLRGRFRGFDISFDIPPPHPSRIMLEVKEVFDFITSSSLKSRRSIRVKLDDILRHLKSIFSYYKYYD